MGSTRVPEGWTGCDPNTVEGQRQLALTNLKPIDMESFPYYPRLLCSIMMACSAMNSARIYACNFCITEISLANSKVVFSLARE